MKKVNWTFIEESSANTILEPGGYVCRITGVQDVPDREYLWIEYDVAEGPKAGLYAGMGADDAWKHRFTRSYKQTAEGMFKAFLSRLEESNRGRFSIEQWQATCDERAFIGLEVGLVFQKELYTNNQGEDKERTVVARVVASQDIRNGDFKVPEPNDRRTVVAAPAAAATNFSADVPF